MHWQFVASRFVLLGFPWHTPLIQDLRPSNMHISTVHVLEDKKMKTGITAYKTTPQYNLEM
jgi:hypothetical protein